MAHLLNPQDEAIQFLSQAHLYRLGDLPTEKSHPGTRSLSTLAKEDLSQAIERFCRVDQAALQSVERVLPLIHGLKTAVTKTLEAGNRVFICGCGATGRLALILEYLWREHYPDQKDKVISFMTGGDLALVRSVENFEDSSTYGERQLQDLGFGVRDLLISCTEGGETPFVIGATRKAAAFSERSPYFLFCNPPEALRVERSREVLEDSRIEKIWIDTGPMALSGSTRLQATSSLMLAVGLALFSNSPDEDFQKFMLSLDPQLFQFLIPFIEKETEAFIQGQRTVYESEEFGITVLSDTTERHPTFSIPAFENTQDAHPVKSPYFFRTSRAATSLEAWAHILNRQPRSLNWSETESRTGEKKLLGFDFSKKELSKGEFLFKISKEGDSLLWSYQGISERIPLKFPSPWMEHLFVKLLLNQQSTLVMGRAGRFEGNVMIWVKPSNGKLIDRAIRYAMQLLEDQHQIRINYESICMALFQVLRNLKNDESAVLKTVEQIVHVQSSNFKRV